MKHSSAHTHTHTQTQLSVEAKPLQTVTARSVSQLAVFVMSRRELSVCHRKFRLKIKRHSKSRVEPE